VKAGISQEKGNDTLSSPIKEHSFALGFQAGYTTGVGFAIKKNFSKNFSL
jgi:hypothetical protein